MPDLSSSGPRDADELLPLVYDELRRVAAHQMAYERPEHTLDATALVHEAYLRLGGDQSFASRSAFLRAAAESMRRILVDHARKKLADKRGGGGRRVELTDAEPFVIPDPNALLALDEALLQLTDADGMAGELARLRLFAGLSITDAAEALGLSRATAFRDWAYARAFLTAALADANAN